MRRDAAVGRLWQAAHRPGWVPAAAAAVQLDQRPRAAVTGAARVPCPPETPSCRGSNQATRGTLRGCASAGSIHLPTVHSRCHAQASQQLHRQPSRQRVAPATPGGLRGAASLEPQILDDVCHASLDSPQGSPLLVEAMHTASVHSLRCPARPPRRVYSCLGRGGPCGAATAASSLTAAEAIRDANAVVLAGSLAPSKSQAWGISEAYTPVNFPPVLRRAGQQQLSSFYRQLLQPAAEADYMPACVDLQLAESAERAAGVTDSADHALVVPWTELPRLRTIFPGLRVRRFESAHDCWTSELKLSKYKYTSVAATRYRGSIVDATADAELWALPPGVAAWPADTPTRGEQAVVDVLVHAPTQTATGRLVDALSRRGWADRVGDAGDWLHAGTPVDAAAKPPPRIAVAPPCAMPFSALERKPSRLPLARETPAWLDATHLEAEATAALDTLACTRWCSPSDVKVTRLTRFTAEEVEADTCEFVLPISPTRALAWMTDGALQSRRVALVAATQTRTVSLRLPDELRHECWDSQSESFAALAAATANADAVAFFCNHASTRSHERAAAYAAWARTPAGAQAGVRRDVRVYVVAGGGLALWKEAEMRGLQLSNLFLHWSND